MENKILCPIDMFTFNVRLTLPNGSIKDTNLQEVVNDINKSIEEYQCYNIHFFGNEHYLSKYVLELKQVSKYNNLKIEIN